MSDFPQGQDYAPVVLSSLSALGLTLSTADGGVSGEGSAAWPAANRAIYVPFVVPAPFVAVKMFVSNGATASGNLDAGIYDDQGNRLVSIGSTAQAGTTANQSLDITDTLLLPGVYYMALAMNGTTGTARRTNIALPLVKACGVLSQSTAFALPATATFAAAQDAYIPLFAVTGRVLV